MKENLNIETNLNDTKRLYSSTQMYGSTNSNTSKLGLLNGSTFATEQEKVLKTLKTSMEKLNQIDEELKKLNQELKFLKAMDKAYSTRNNDGQTK